MLCRFIFECFFFFCLNFFIVFFCIFGLFVVERWLFWGNKSCGVWGWSWIFFFWGLLNLDLSCSECCVDRSLVMKFGGSSVSLWFDLRRDWVKKKICNGFGKVVGVLFLDYSSVVLYVFCCEIEFSVIYLLWCGCGV